MTNKSRTSMRSRRNTRFGNISPVDFQPGNNEIAMNNPLSNIYTYSSPHTYGLINDSYSNLSGFPWYKPSIMTTTLAVQPNNLSRFGDVKTKKVKTRKTIKKNKNVQKSTKSSKKWIQGAIKRPGSLTSYARKIAPGNGKSGAFTKRGTLKVKWLRHIQKNGTPLRRKQAQLALNLKKLNKNSQNKSKKSKKMNSFGKYPGKQGNFNYTIQQYANNASTPTETQLHRIGSSAPAAYSFPMGMGSASGLNNMRWYVPKSNIPGLGRW